MKIVKGEIKLQKLKNTAQETFGDLVKAVVDVEKEVMAIGGMLHADEEALLLGSGSKQQDLWGINLYPELFGEDDFIEFDSLINVRPSQNNMSRGVEDREIQKKIKSIVKRLVAV
jgi:hypothetical protein